MSGHPFSRVVSRFPEVGVFLVLVFFTALFSIIARGFFSTDTLITVLVAAAELGTIAIGVSILMIAGEFDISVGSVFCFATLIFCIAANFGIPIPACFIITLMASAGIGCCNGMMTVFLGIPSFIATLGAMLFWRGLHGILTKGADVSLKEGGKFLEILGGNPFVDPTDTSPLQALKMTAVWFPIFAVGVHLLLQKTRFGNHVFATGGNRDAARNAGVKVRKIKILCFTLAGALVGFASAANVAQYRGSTGMLGEYKELDAIAACVVGGNLLTGGRGTILGTVLGVLLLEVIRTGLSMLGDAYWYRPLTGIIIIVAAVLNEYIRKFEE